LTGPGENFSMQIHVQTPAASLIVDPFAGAGNVAPSGTGGGGDVATRRSEAIHHWFMGQVAEITGSAITPDTPPIEIRNKIVEVEQKLTESVKNGETVDTNPLMPLFHHFADNAYAREMHILKGNMIVGKIHKHSLFNFITRGRITVINEHEGVQVLVGPCFFKSPAGIKRLVFAHEDTVWIGIHPTSETDLSKIEDEFLAKSFVELLEYQGSSDSLKEN